LIFKGLQVFEQAQRCLREGKVMKPSILKVISCFVIVSLISGCATSRYVETPSAPPPDLGIASRDNNISVALNYLILINGQGAWVKDARWDEYVLTVRNISDKTITVEKIRLVDPRGLYIEGGVDPSQLETMSEALAKEIRTWVYSLQPAQLSLSLLQLVL
jgi:hypothetical protein